MALSLVSCAALAACAKDATAPAVDPGVVVAVTRPSLALTQGEHASVDVTITRLAGFAGAVTLTVSGAPAGITADVATNPVTGESATIGLSVGEGVSPGAYRLTLSATGPGIRAVAVTLDLQVSSRSVASVTVPYCTGIEPQWVAFQDGDGPWSRALPDVSGAMTTFHHEFTSNRGAIATLTPIEDGALTDLRVLYGTPAELASEGDTLAFNCGAVAPRTWHGSVAGLGANESALVSSGPFLHAAVDPAAGGLFSLRDVPSGKQDLLASRATQVDGDAALTRLILRRDLDLPDGDEVARLDFASAEAFAPATANVSIMGGGAEGVFSLTYLYTKNSRLLMPSLPEQNFATTRTYFALPESQLLAGDLQVLHLLTAGPSSASRSASVYFRSPTDQTLTLGPPVVAPTISVESTQPSLRLRARFVTQPVYDQSTAIMFQQSSTSAFVTISMTAAYGTITGAGYDLVVPDLSGVAGFDPAWGLRAGDRVFWAVTRTGGTAPLGQNAVPTVGAIQRTAFLKDAITLP